MAQEIPATMLLKRPLDETEPNVLLKRVHQDDNESDSDSDYSDAESITRSTRTSTPIVPTPSTPLSPAPSSKAHWRPNIYHCTFEGCSRSFNRPVRLAEHIRSHTNERPYACIVEGCDKTFIRDGHLTRHMKSSHSNVRDHVCDWEGCDKRFLTATRLRRHQDTHEKKEKYHCTQDGCNEYFRKHSTLQRHIQSVHLHQKSYVCTHTNEDTGESCTYSADQPGTLRSHINRMHSGEKFWCNICGPEPSEATPTLDNNLDSIARSSHNLVGFKTYTQFLAHMREVHPPTCPHCSKAHATPSALQSHIEIHHGGVPLSERRTFLCTFPGCDRGFTKQGNLNVHIKTVHDPVKKWVCGDTINHKKEELHNVPNWNGPGCGRDFRTKGNLEEHIRTQHLGLERKMKARKRKKAPDSDSKIPKSRGPSGAPAVSTLARLTGAGYAEESGYKIVCTQQGCAFRFARDFDLATHLRKVHKMGEQDVVAELVEREADRVEKEALAGGVFWIGGEADGGVYGNVTDMGEDERIDGNRKERDTIGDVERVNRGQRGAIEDEAWLDPVLRYLEQG
ncbi:hypothetical protein M501DRAFT_1017747 [Patellaria atrata CBS 101060]|uniref:C2H2-type domain-containing protein n=1 Tax=Patellaria atrata CBS 101060 TaxID=1346257 RepID=A0A9P4S9Z4_9PEZI|nr:hypothetical protein M501DRAFT_1017747 [Patellaria atrata CBS 101060]